MARHGLLDRPTDLDALRRTLRGFDARGLKRADVGGDPSTSFEQAFSSLGYAYLKDKAPRLLDFIVGFQLVDRNEDNTKAVGIFGCKVGDQWLYIPVFFLNGDLKGHELLYIKKQDTFVPLKENWVNYLISRKPHALGEASPRDTQQLGGLLPNLQRLARPPAPSKYGSDGGSPRVDAWARPFLPVLAAARAKSAAFLDGPAAAAARLDLAGFLDDFGLLKLAYERHYLAYPLIKAGFDRFYGPGFFARAGERLRDRAIAGPDLLKTARSYVMPPRRPRRRPPPDSMLPEPEEPEAKRGSLRVFLFDERTKAAVEATGPNKLVGEDSPGGVRVNLPLLEPDEREKLLKDKVLIKDERDPHAVSMAYNTQVRTVLTNPDTTGLFSVLEKAGVCAEMLVILTPHTGRGHERFSLLVRKSDPRSWLNTHRTNIWTRQAETPSDEAFRDYVDGLPAIDSLEVGNTYVAIHARGEGTCPFRVREDYGDGAYKVEWKDYCEFGTDRPAFLPPIDRPVVGWAPRYDSWDSMIRLNRRQGAKLRASGGELSIPDAFKVIKVADAPKPKDDDPRGSFLPASMPPYAGPESETPPIRPGNMADVERLLYELPDARPRDRVDESKNAAAVKLALHDVGGGEVVFAYRDRVERLEKRAALVHLVAGWGLREGVARVMLKEAAAAAVTNRAASYLVVHDTKPRAWPSGYEYTKKADLPGGSVLQPGPGAPGFPQPWTGFEQVGYNQYPAIYPQEEQVPVPGMDANLTDPTIYDPFYRPDRNAMQVAQTAAQSGQKQVFDTSMVSSLLKAVRQDSLVDRYLGDLMKALDHLGRILFMFYWHNEEFEDRYGKAELPELEDGVRNAFETLGDVVLFLKEKTIQGGAGVEIGTGAVDTDTAEPSISEAARN